LHNYVIFSGGPLPDNPPASFATQVCNGWGASVNTTSGNFGFVSGGEFSAAINDCGLWVNQVDTNPRFEDSHGAGACDTWNDYPSWTADRKAGIQTFVTAEMDSLRNWFFWTWRIGPSLTTGKIETPMWSYELGWRNGWIPADPRTAEGTCAKLGFAQDTPFSGQYQPGQVDDGGSLTPTTTEDYSWPPPTLSGVGDAAGVPSYTPTGAIMALPTPTFTDAAAATATIDAGTGWFDQADTAGLYVPINGCSYLDNWDALGLPVPPPCP